MLSVANALEEHFHLILFPVCYAFCPREAEQAFEAMNLIPNSSVFISRDELKERIYLDENT